MESRSSTDRDDKRDAARVKVSDEVIVEEQIQQEQPETVLVTLLKQLNLKHIGKVTGKLYQFTGAGSQLPIDIRDIDYFEEKNRLITSCCKDRVYLKYFEIVR